MPANEPASGTVVPGGTIRPALSAQPEWESMAGRGTEASFLGRVEELSELRALLDRAADGAGALALLAGEPGIGKSRLADELGARAREAGHIVLWGRAWEDAGAPPYWPWIQALRTYLRNVDAAMLRRQLGPGAGDVAQILPELTAILDDVTATEPSDADAARFQLFDSVTTFVRNAATDRRLLIVLDDLHTADTPSIRLLRFLARQLGEIPLLVVGTYRDIELTPGHPLTDAIASLGREPATRVISLGGLGREAVRDLIGDVAGRSPTDAVVAAVQRGTNGNPLYVREAMRLLRVEGSLAEGMAAPTHLVVPASVRTVIGRRLARLAAPTRDVLALGSVIGPEFTRQVLATVADVDDTTLTAALDDGVVEGLLLELPGGPHRYRFGHDLIRETLYDELLPSRRVELHGLVAEGLEQLYGAHPDAHLPELAHHFTEAAGDATATAKAIDYARRAGERAARSLAFEEAARLYGMALAHVDRSGNPDQRERLSLLLALGDALARGGDLAAASGLYLEAADIAKQVGAPEALGRAALGLGGRMPWARPGTETRLIPLLQDALVHLGGENDALRVRLLTRLACAWRSSPEQRQQSDAISRQAVELARTLDDQRAIGYAITGRYWATWWPDNTGDRLSLAREMEDLAAAIGDDERLIDAHLMLWLSHTELSDMQTARQEAELVRKLVVELRQPAQRWLSIAPRALMVLFEGDLAGAEALIEEEMDPRISLTMANDNISAGRAHLFLLRREQGRVGEVEGLTRRSVDEFPWYPLHRSALANLLIDLGRDDEARAVIEALARDEFSALYPDNEWLLGACWAAEAVARLRMADAAEVLLGQLAPFAGRHAIGHTEGSVGVVDRYLGLLALSLDRLDAGIEALEAAVAINRRMHTRPWTAHAEHDLADALRRRAAPGDAARAAELDARALATAKELGMTWLASRIEVEGATPAPPTADSAGTFRRDGETWTIGFDGGSFTLRDSKGLGYLARLLADPGRELHALDLAAPSGGMTPRPSDGEGLEVAGGSGAGAALDGAAKAEYRQRMADLAAELDEAEAWHDPERAASARRGARIPSERA